MAYRFGTTIRKGGKEGAYAVGAGAAVTMAMEAARSRGYLPWEQEHDAKITGALFGLLVAGFKALRNYLKERRKRRREERRVRNLNGFRG